MVLTADLNSVAILVASFLVGSVVVSTFVRWRWMHKEKMALVLIEAESSV